MKYLPKISSGIVSLMGVVVFFFGLNMMAVWNTVPTSDKRWLICGLIYFLLTSATGWVYVARNIKTLGATHAILMFGGAIIIGGYGLIILNDRSIAGGSGPEANPVGGIVYAGGFLLCVIALVMVACGFGVLWILQKSKR